MKYTVGWVEKNLGVSRKAIRCFEKKGLLDTSNTRNQNNNYREFDDNDLHCIWIIKIFEGMGYSLSEIAEIVDNPDYDLCSSLTDKILDLEKKKAEIQQLIDYAKSIKATGQIPLFPKVMGSTTVQDYQKHAIDNMLEFSPPQFSDAISAFVNFQSKPLDEINEEEIRHIQVIFKTMCEYLKQNPIPELADPLNALETFINIKPNDITAEDLTRLLNNLRDIDLSKFDLDRRILQLQITDVSDPEIQDIIQHKYETMLNSLASSDQRDLFTKHVFSKYMIRQFMSSGDMSALLQGLYSYGKDGCQFLAKAYAYFGGYKKWEDAIDN